VFVVLAPLEGAITVERDRTGDGMIRTQAFLLVLDVEFRGGSGKLDRTLGGLPAP
jgi:hypothetical protein